MASLINYRLRVTILDGRQLVRRRRRDQPACAHLRCTPTGALPAHVSPRHAPPRPARSLGVKEA